MSLFAIVNTFISGLDKNFEVFHQHVAQAKNIKSLLDILIFSTLIMKFKIFHSLYFFIPIFTHIINIWECYFVKLWIILQKPPCFYLLFPLLAYNLDHGREAIKILTNQTKK